MASWRRVEKSVPGRRSCYVGDVCDREAMRRTWSGLFGLASCAVVFAGCGPDQAHPAWRVRFERDADRDRASVVEVAILSGGCEGPAEYKVLLARGERATEDPPPLRAGRYGFRARARARDCSVVAEGCTAVPLPREEPIEVSMQPASRPRVCSACDGEGRCPGEPGYRGSGSSEDGGAGRLDGSGGGTDAGTGCGPCAARDASGRCDGASREGAACVGAGGAPGICRAGTCGAGCWDGSAWRDGTDVDACGRGGLACRSCGPCEQCGASGACEPVTDGTDCRDATNTQGKCLAGRCCTGCVNERGACVPPMAQDFGGCGLGGGTCAMCDVGQTCCSGVCRGSCS